MPTRSPKIDAYLAKVAPFARPILEHAREVVHAACPEVEESVKWGRPFFEYRGPLCTMAAFKAHADFMFWKGDVLEGAGSGGRFRRLTSVKDLPSKPELVRLIRQAMKLNEGGVKADWQVRRQAKANATKTKAPAEVKPPAELAAALRKNAKARATWDGFAVSHRREYATWISEAKREETKAKRVAQTVTWLAEGKSRNWKYS